MPIEILMPALSPTMEEGTLSKWVKNEGDTVKSGDVIAEIETDKATMEVEAVDEGVIGKILVAAGTEGVKVNTAIAVLLQDGESADAVAAPKAAAAEKPAEAPAPAAAAPAAAAAPVPDGSRDRKRGGDVSVHLGSGQGRCRKMRAENADERTARRGPRRGSRQSCEHGLQDRRSAEAHPPRMPSDRKSCSSNGNSPPAG